MMSNHSSVAIRGDIKRNTSAERELIWSERASRSYIEYVPLRLMWLPILGLLDSSQFYQSLY